MYVEEKEKEKEKSPRQTGDQPNFSAAADAGMRHNCSRHYSVFGPRVGRGHHGQREYRACGGELGWAVEQAK